MLGLDETVAQLEGTCSQLLAVHPDGLSEHELLCHLREPPYELMPPLTLDDSLGLFQSHFLLFHVLYRLRDKLRLAQEGELSISPLLIQIQPYAAGESALEGVDPLRDYYLDLSQLGDTDAETVEAMLGGFWGQLGSADEKAQALATLELTEPVSLAEVKAQYRRLAMQHHPDRGGDHGQMHALNRALSILQRCMR